MPKPTLDQSFPEGRPTRAPAQHHSWLTAQERRFILWGLKERWPAARIAADLRVNEATVRRFRNRFWEDPGEILELGPYEMVGRAKDEEYRCLVCEERVVSPRGVQRHVLSHFVDQVRVDRHLPRASKRSSKQDGYATPLNALGRSRDPCFGAWRIVPGLRTAVAQPQSFANGSSAAPVSLFTGLHNQPAIRLCTWQ
jgi:hypothetical protein